MRLNKQVISRDDPLRPSWLACVRIDILLARASAEGLARSILVDVLDDGVDVV
jgi:hypothetical protein